ncbi:MAG: hypothetical protein J6Y80_06870 [Victivallales bacterium]|nr:hypothetical protein [Victivallales bacterium]
MRITELVKRQSFRRAPAGRDWRDGLFTGNGRLGVLASANDSLEYVLNSNEVFNGAVSECPYRPHAEVLRRMLASPDHTARFLDKEERLLEAGGADDDTQRRTLSAAILRIRFGYGIGWSAPAAPAFSQALDPCDAVATAQVSSHLFHVGEEHFVPHGRPLLCLRLHERERGAPPPRSLWERPAVVELAPTESLAQIEYEILDGGTARFIARLPTGHRYCVALRIQADDGGSVAVRRTANGLSFTCESPNFTLFSSVRSEIYSPGFSRHALLDLDWAGTRGYAALREHHARRWHDFWNRSHVYFADEPELQRAFTLCLYTLGSTFGHAPIPGLNGLLYGPLNSFSTGVSFQGYTHDQNVQIPFLPFLPLNHLEFFDAWAETYLHVLPELRRHTREVYGRRGICLPLGMNQLGVAAPTRSYRYTLCGGAYTGCILARRWKSQPDERFFRKFLHPLLREFALFYFDGFTPGPDGRLVLEWSIPPEIFRFTRNDNATLALLKPMLETLAEACETYGIDLSLARQCREHLAHFPDFCRRPDGGWWCGPDIPSGHYMWGSHLLYPFFPAEADLDPEAAERTLEYIDQFGIERAYDGPLAGEWHFSHAWSWFLDTVSHQRLGHRERAWAELHRFLKLFGKENGLFTHNAVIIAPTSQTEANARTAPVLTREGNDGKPATFPLSDGQCATPNPAAKRLAPAVIEGSAEFLFAATEALLQSHGGVIRLFPGVPDDFTGAFHALRTAAGLLVSARMRRGVVQSCRLVSRRDIDVAYTVLLPGAARPLCGHLLPRESIRLV